jgi:hypothetical protein
MSHKISSQNNKYCIHCDYTTSKKSDYDKHLLTAKHINRTSKVAKVAKVAKVIKEELKCECGKIYKVRNSLWYHKQKCIFIKEETEEITEEKNEEITEEKKEEGPDYKELLIQAMTEMTEMRKETNQLVTQNTELVTKMTEMMPSMGNTTNNTNSNNTTNNTFNLQFFLNETCKDALNLTDFINSLQLQLKDLEYTANNGHIKGITNIFQTALSNMEENKRPMHCTDLKREIMYIKDNDEWSKDDEKEKMKGTINQITNKNIGNIEEWLAKYPGHINPNSKDFDKFVKMTSNCMGTGNEADDDKIVRNVMKEVIIKKRESGG